VTLSTSSFKQSWMRAFFCFAGICILLNVASLVTEKVTGYNFFRIDYQNSYAIKKHLIERYSINSGNNFGNNFGGAKSYQILMAGTSRTMADFSPEMLSKHTGLSAYNLGNIANSYSSFFTHFKTISPPSILFLETSYHQFLQPEEKATSSNLNKLYQQYRKSITLLNEGIQTRLSQLLFPLGLPRVGKTALKNLAVTITTSKFNAQDLFLAYKAKDYGQALTPSGQILYRTYLSTQEESDSLSKWANESSALNQKHRNTPLSNAQAKALENIIKYAKNNDIQLVLVRPPIDLSLRASENTRDDITALLQKLTRQSGVQYIDLSDSTGLSLSDGSHVDWFDTNKITQKLINETTFTP